MKKTKLTSTPKRAATVPLSTVEVKALQAKIGKGNSFAVTLTTPPPGVRTWLERTTRIAHVLLTKGDTLYVQDNPGGLTLREMQKWCRQFISTPNNHPQAA